MEAQKLKRKLDSKVIPVQLAHFIEEEKICSNYQMKSLGIQTNHHKNSSNKLIKEMLTK